MPESIDELARVAFDHETALKQQSFRKSLLEQSIPERFTSVRCIAQPKLVNRRRQYCTLFELLARAASRRRRQLLAEVGARDLVHLEERLAQPRVISRLIRIDRLRQRHPE